MVVHFMELATLRALREANRLEEEPVEIEPLPGVRLRVRALDGVPIVAGLGWDSLQRALRAQGSTPFELFGWKVEPLHKGDPRVQWAEHWTREIEQVRDRLDRWAAGLTSTTTPTPEVVAAERAKYPEHAWLAAAPDRVPVPEGKRWLVTLRLDSLLSAMFVAEPKYELAS